ncbi:MAG: PDZ domain-containing protein [Planctomycetaceae bacterium]
MSPEHDEHDEHETAVISPVRRGGRGPGPWPSFIIGVAFALGSAWTPADEPTVAPPETPAAASPPGEISVEEPIPVRFGGRFPPPASRDAPSWPAPSPINDPFTAAPPPAAEGSAVPGSGWIGLGVAESNVPGRWRIAEVVSGGPAARANIAVGDELRAVNGVTLTSAAEVTQAFTSLASGQDVRVAVARADQVSDVVLRAEPRPAVRTEQPSAAAAALPAAAPDASAAPTTAPATAATPPATAGPAASVPAWQAAQTPSPPPAAAAPRFGAVAPPDPVATTAPAPAAMPRASIAPPPLSAPRSATLPDPLPREAGGAPAGGRTALGVRSVPVDPATQSRFKLASPAGAYVVGVVHDLPAARAGVPPGSVIVALDERPVRSPVELTELVTRGPIDKPVTVQFVLPGGESKRANVVLQALDAPLERALTAGPEPAAAPPALQPGPVPRLSERPAGDDGPVRAEIRALRSRLERLERLLDPRDSGR